MLTIQMFDCTSFVVHFFTKSRSNRHVERSGSTNAASAEAACGLCRARRRKTNAVQSNICIVSIQILRRSAPQNDKLFIVRKLRSRLEYATGGNAERWKEKMFGATAVCRDKHRLQPCEPKPRHAETRRIYKSPFLTGLAPQASAREHLRHRSTALDKKPVPTSLISAEPKP